MLNKPNLDRSIEVPEENLDRCFSIVRGRNASLGNLYYQAWQLSRRLPEGRYVINLCENRYAFTVCYFAVIFQGKTNLLPQNRSRRALESLLQEYSGSYCISDNPAMQYPGLIVGDGDFLQNGRRQVPHIRNSAVASISFTSGSTGEPKAIPKTFGEFLKSAELATERLGIGFDEIVLVSTVPPQHMYGLETSVFWPMVADTSIRSDRPFFPEDIRRTVAESEKPCLLISTPTHLKACAESDLRWTNLARVLSSTASMPAGLADLIEQNLGAPLFEIFGSTETMSFASRRPTESQRWQPYRGIRIKAENNHCIVQGGHIARAVRIDDRVKVDPDGCFTLSGRSSDLVKIAGKRASLAELNRVINSIEGVHDGLFYLTECGRLGALVVSRRSKKSILAELRQSIDEVFLPRPFHRIKEIPRNEVGKIVKLKLDRLIRNLDIA